MTEKFRQVTFPAVMRGKVLCPLCKDGIVGMIVQDRGPVMLPNKWVVPCMHPITPDQERAVVNDMYKRGL